MIEYKTSVESAMLIMREMERLRFIEQFEPMAGLIRQYLEENGVVFPPLTPTERPPA